MQMDTNLIRLLLSNEGDEEPLFKALTACKCSIRSDLAG